MNLVLVLLSLAVVLGVGAAIAYRLLNRTQVVANPFAREEAQLASYEDALRRLEIKAQTVGYDDGDQARYAELIAYRNSLRSRLTRLRPVTA